MVDQALLEQAKKLSVAERLELADAIWDTVDVDAVPVTPAEAALIDRRVAEADANPAQSRPWSDVEADLRARFR